MHCILSVHRKLRILVTIDFSLHDEGQFDTLQFDYNVLFYRFFFEKIYILITSVSASNIIQYHLKRDCIKGSLIWFSSKAESQIHQFHGSWFFSYMDSTWRLPRGSLSFQESCLTSLSCSLSHDTASSVSLLHLLEFTAVSSGPDACTQIL